MRRNPHIELHSTSCAWDTTNGATEDSSKSAADETHQVQDQEEGDDPVVGTSRASQKRSKVRTAMGLGPKTSKVGFSAKRHALARAFVRQLAGEPESREHINGADSRGH